MNTSDFGANVFDEPQGPSHPDDEAHKAAGRTRKRSPRKKKVAAEAEEDTAQARPAAESGPVADFDAPPPRFEDDLLPPPPPRAAAAPVEIVMEPDSEAEPDSIAPPAGEEADTSEGEGGRRRRRRRRRRGGRGDAREAEEAGPEEAEAKSESDDGSDDFDRAPGDAPEPEADESTKAPEDARDDEDSPDVDREDRGEDDLGGEAATDTAAAPGERGFEREGRRRRRRRRGRRDDERGREEGPREDRPREDRPREERVEEFRGPRPHGGGQEAPTRPWSPRPEDRASTRAPIQIPTSDGEARGARVAILIDLDFLLERARARDAEIAFGRVVASLGRRRHVVRAIAYATAEAGEGMRSLLLGNGIELMTVRRMNALPAAIAVDAMNLQARVDAVVLIPPADDLEPIARALRSAGVRVESADFTDTELGADSLVQAHHRLGDECLFEP